MPDAKLVCGGLKQSGQIPSTVEKVVGKLKTIVCLETLHLNNPTGVPFGQLFQEVSGRIDALFRVSSQKV